MERKYLEINKNQNLRTCQLKQVKILDEIVKICDDYDIDYWLDGGTLLGAVRHGGFIPWDDDIDIAMTKVDHDRFLKVATTHLPTQMQLFNPYLEKGKEPVTKVRDLNSLYIEFGDDFQAEYEKGIFVDIFPFVPCPSIPDKLIEFIGKGASKSYSILHKKHYYSIRSFAEFFYFGLKYIVCLCLWKITSVFIPNGRYLSNTIYNNQYGKRHLRDSVFPLTTMEFEGKKYKVPANSDVYLKDLYGDYMQLPPEDKRIGHAYYFNPILTDNCELD